MNNAKNEKSNNQKSAKDKTMIMGSQLKSLGIIIVVVSIIFLIFYGVTLLIGNKEKKVETGVLQEVIQYDEILVGQITNRKENEYYVLLTKDNNSYNTLYTTYLNTYVNAKTGRKYYTADLSNALNLPYVGTETKVSTSDFLSSKFSETTLIKVKKKKIDKIYSTHEDIIAILKKLVA